MAQIGEVQLAGVEGVIRRYIEVPQVAEKTVTLQRTISIEKPVRKVVHKEVEKFVEVEKIVEVEKVVEVDEVELRVRHVPIPTRQEVPRYVDREVAGPVETRIVEKIIEQEEVVTVPREIFVEKPYPQDVFVEQAMPLIAMQRISQQMNLHATRAARSRIVLKRYNPKFVPVDVPIELTVEEILRRGNIKVLENYSKFDDGRSTQFGDSTIASGVPADASTARLRTYVEMHPTTLETVKAVQDAGLTLGNIEFNNAHFNSWLLALNDHLITRPEAISHLPWARSASGTVEFLPEGSRLTGSLITKSVAESLGVAFPKYMPVVTTPLGKMAADEAAAKQTPKVLKVGAPPILRQDLATEKYENMQRYLEPCNWEAMQSSSAISCGNELEN